MLYACVQKFDVTGTVENFLGTKRGLTVKLSVTSKKGDDLSIQIWEVRWTLSHYFNGLLTSQYKWPSVLPN